MGSGVDLDEGDLGGTEALFLERGACLSGGRLKLSSPEVLPGRGGTCYQRKPHGCVLVMRKKSSLVAYVAVLM